MYTEKSSFQLFFHASSTSQAEFSTGNWGHEQFLTFSADVISQCRANSFH